LEVHYWARRSPSLAGGAPLFFGKRISRLNIAEAGTAYCFSGSSPDRVGRSANHPLDREKTLFSKSSGNASNPLQSV